MNIKRVPISDVEAWEKNPRNIKTKDMERLKRQIQELGVYKPLICVRENGKYITLGGNMRLRALQALKVGEVDISIVKAPNEATKIKYALSDNDRAGEYEEQKLAELVYPHIEEINLEDFKVDMSEPWCDLKMIIERVGPDIDPNKEWQGMPEVDDKGEAIRTIHVHFRTEEDIEKFSKLIKQKITEKTRAVWFPEWKRQNYKNEAFIDES